MSEGNLVLIVDDDEKILIFLSHQLKKHGYSVITTTDADKTIEIIEKNPVKLVILDLAMPLVDGITVLKNIVNKWPSLPVIMLSGYGTISKAVEAIKLGAYDFLEKPVETQRIILTIENALLKSRLERERSLLVEDALERYKMVGISKPMKEIFQLIDKIAPTDSRVLITGESGTGKELVARAIHLRSKRAGQPFQIVNCAAIPDELIESELFGHEKGAFTGAVQRQIGKFELANGGTLFLDEIGDMSLKTQAKVLRAIEEGEIQRIGGEKPVKIDVRIISASCKDLKLAIKKGLFREDLYFRLSVINIFIPPLRERKEDIPLLVDYFLKKFCEENKRPIPTIHSSAIEFMLDYQWPGNVRELRNLMEKIAVLSGSEKIYREEIENLIKISAIDEPLNVGSNMETLSEAKKKAEKEKIISKLISTNWNYKRTAEELGISRSTLFSKIKEYGIRRGEIE